MRRSSAPAARPRTTSTWSTAPATYANVTVRDPEKVVWLSQTTLSVDETMETVRRLRERFPALQDPPSDDICYATQNRQAAVKKLAPEADLMIVVGSRNSSNSVRLVEVAVEHGAGAGYLVDYADEIDEAWLEGVPAVGVTSGASVPEVLVRDVLSWLAERGYGEVAGGHHRGGEPDVLAAPRAPRRPQGEGHGRHRPVRPGLRTVRGAATSRPMQVPTPDGYAR